MTESATSKSRKGAKRSGLGHQRNEVRKPNGPRRRWLAAAAVLVLAGTPFLAGNYLQLHTPAQYDIAAFVYSANQVLERGGDAWEQSIPAWPGMLAMNVLGVAMWGYDTTGPSLIQSLFLAGALVAVFFAVRRAFGLTAAVVSVTIASLTLTAPLVARWGYGKEQFFTPFMMLGVSFLMLHELGRKWWWAVLSGAALIWAPTFKATAISAILAAGIFLVAQPLLKHISWKQFGRTIGLMFAGAAAGMAPLVLWLAVIDAPISAFPYWFVARTLGVTARSAESETADKEAEVEPQEKTSYLGGSWAVSDIGDVAAATFRYYRALSIVVLPAAVALLLRFLLGGLHLAGRLGGEDVGRNAHLVLLLGAWWLLDMAFGWISPRVYETYFIPLCGSGAMLAGYGVGRVVHFLRRTSERNHRTPVLAGVAAILFLALMARPVVAGVTHDLRRGTPYDNRRAGYVQAFRQISEYRRAKQQGRPAEPWQRVGRYIRRNSQPNDEIYVWGWLPGIYVEAKRRSAYRKPSTSEMHRWSPAEFRAKVADMLVEFKTDPPLYIVDTRKPHYPFDRPPLEWWPTRGLRGPLSDNPAAVRSYEMQYRELLRKQVGEDEARRFDAMAPLREYVRKNYRIVGRWMQTPQGSLINEFHPNLVLRRKDPTSPERGGP